MGGVLPIENTIKSSRTRGVSMPLPTKAARIQKILPIIGSSAIHKPIALAVTV
jgi:hypothetical protein